MGSLNYRFFAVSDRPAFQVNTRMYSFILIRNSIKQRWRLSRNEDTVISMDVMEDDWKTLMLNTFLANKAATQKMKGGNSSEIYQKEGTGYKSQVLYDAYPQYVELVERWNRPHHFVDYNKHWPDKELGLDSFRYKVPEDSEYGLYLKSDKKENFYPQCLT